MTSHRLRILASTLSIAAFAACAGGTQVGDGGDARDGTGTGDGITTEGGGGDGIGGDSDDAMGTDTGGVDTGGSDTGGTDTGGTDTGGADTVGMACTVPSRSCYSGPAGTMGMGVCAAGVQMCIAGTFGTCMGEITPTAEACNGRDDNCDGMIDEGLPTISCGIGACRRTVPSCVMGRLAMCMPGTAGAEMCGNGIDDNCNGAIDEGCMCTYVATSGNDATGTGSASAPFRTIVTGIARAGTMGLPNTVCVANGDFTENVVMRNGIHVYGGYMTAATSPWPRPPTVSRIASTMDRGVYFGPTVTMPTILDGFTLTATNGAANAAVTVEGSTGAVISNNIITGGGGTTSIAVEVLGMGGMAATPQILRNTIVGGTGSTVAIGVHSLRSAPVIQANCNTTDAMGRCTSGCPAGSRGIRGRANGNMGAQAYGIRLEDSPGSLVDASGVCTGTGTTDVAGVRISGNAMGTVVRGSNVGAFGGGSNAVAIWMDPCGGASPWIVNNTFLSGSSPMPGARADGVRAVGACHPVVDSNVRIVGGVESANNDANGVLCAADSAGVASRCTVLGNTSVEGAGGGFPPNATGVRCENGSCIRVESNAMITGRSGVNAFGLTLVNTGAVVRLNTIEGGCATREATGIRSENSYARVENNLVFGNRCANTGAMLPASWGVRVLLAAGANEIDLHSNDIFGEGPPVGLMGACTSHGITFDVLTGGAPPTAPRGVVRNNVVHPGRCNTRYGIEEANIAADPRLLQNNDLWFQTAGDPLYRDENATNLAMVAMVNALTATMAALNISADPLFVGMPNYRLQMTSPCVNAGTATGAPTVDFYGTMRPRGSAPDIGAAEF